MLSIDVINSIPQSNLGRKWSICLTLSHLCITEGSQGMNSSKNLDTEIEAETIELLSDLLPLPDHQAFSESPTPPTNNRLGYPPSISN